MRRLIYAALLLAACTAHAPQGSMEVAEAAYQALIDERWDDYLSLTATADSLPSDIRQERIDMLREYMTTEQSERGGITAVRPLRDTLVAPDLSYVFLELSWADSTSEEILLPLVLVGDTWRIR